MHRPMYLPLQPAHSVQQRSMPCYFKQLECLSTTLPHAVEVHVLFDTGSQQSYITNQLVQLLKLEAKSTQTLSIGTFGAACEQKKGMSHCLSVCVLKELLYSVTHTACSPYDL